MNNPLEYIEIFCNLNLLPKVTTGQQIIKTILKIHFNNIVKRSYSNTKGYIKESDIFDTYYFQNNFIHYISPLNSHNSVLRVVLEP